MMKSAIRNALTILWASSFAGAATIALPASAQGTGNHAPVCSDKVLIVEEPLREGATFQFNPVSSAPACRDPDGDLLTVTTVTQPAVVLTTKAGYSRNLIRVPNDWPKSAKRVLTYTVVDGRGGTTTGTISLERQTPEGVLGTLQSLIQ